MSDLANFLLARYAAEEALARKASDVDWAADALSVDDFAFACEWSPARVLAECEAKRAVLKTRQSFIAAAQAATTLDMRLTAAGAVAAIDALLPYLALPYADHPDYRQEWRP